VYERVSETDNGVVEARVLGVLRGPRAGLITDIDGTLSPIVAVPSDAVVLPRARDALLGLKKLLEVVAVVTGRSVADARQLVGIDGLLYIGNHGMEVWAGGEAQTVAEVQAWVPRVAVALEELKARAHMPGVVFEEKGPSASVHYRLAADPVRTRRELLELMATTPSMSALRMEEGRMVINLLPPVSVNKGSAVTWLAKEHRLERLVYIGDDLTDTHGFLALRGLRDVGQAETLNIGVVGPETPDSVRQLADMCVGSPHAVAELLTQVMEDLQSSDTMNERELQASGDTEAHGKERASD
jgi:trehalose 6-phosphate phosphatase